MTSLLTLAGLVLGSAVLTHVLIVPVRRLGTALGLVDYPSWRRAHRDAVPCSGGVAIYLATAIGGAAVASFAGSLFSTPALASLAVAGLLTILLGVADDRFGLHAEKKLLGQILVVMLPMSGGLMLRQLHLPWGGDVELGLLAGPLTVFWYLGFINSINLIDGLDGLAGGIAAVVLGVMLLAVSPADPVAGLWTAVLLGSVLGFLRSNLSRSRIFLGDAGSMLLGLWLAGLSLGLAQHTPSVPWIAVTAMAVPILDTTTTIVRRVRRRVSIFRADDEHFHHRWLRLGTPAPRAVACLWLLSLAGAALGVAVTGIPSAAIVALGALAAVAIELAYTLPHGGRPTAVQAIRYLLWLPGAWQEPSPQARLAEVIEMQPYRTLRARGARASVPAAAAAAKPPAATATTAAAAAAMAGALRANPRPETAAPAARSDGNAEPAEQELDVVLATTEDTL